MHDATPLTPLAHERNYIFKCKQHTYSLHDPWGPEKYDYTMMQYGASFYSHHTGTKHKQTKSIVMLPVKSKNANMIAIKTCPNMFSNLV